MILGIVCLFLAPIVAPIFSPWSRINCREQEIDVLSGLRQDTRFIYWLPVSQKVSGTSLSKALSVNESEARDRRWNHVNSFGPYTRHSPHYIYHSAFSQIRNLEMIWDMFEVDAAERAATAKGLLREWQTTGTDSSADAYLQEIMKTAEQDAP